MNDNTPSHQSTNSLEDILKELEERFGINSEQENRTPQGKKNKGVGFKKFGQNQIIGGLTLVLLIVGAAAGVYLGQSNQELRQRAQVNPYPTCREACIAAGDNPSLCSVFPACPPCRERCSTQFPDAGSYCNGLRSCGQPDCPGQPPGSFCQEPGGTCGTLGYVTVSTGCENVGGVSCCPGSPATHTPTRPPNTNTPVPPTAVPPTGVPPTAVPPTNRPATNTPTRTPTISGTTGNLTFCKVVRQCGAILSNWSSIPDTTFTMTFSNTALGFNQTINIPSDTPNTTLPGGMPAFCTTVQVPRTANQTTNYTYSRENISSFGWETQIYYDTTNLAQSLTTSLFCAYAGTCNGTAANSDGAISLTNDAPAGRVVVINTKTCSGPTSTPTTTPPGATCNGINIAYGGTEPNRPVRIGDNITLTCGSIAGAARYEFRLFINGNFLRNLNPISTTSRVSEPFTIAQPGNYSAQCRMCTDSTANSCQPWETLP